MNVNRHEPAVTPPPMNVNRHEAAVTTAEVDAHGYRPLSGLAITALVLGILSVSALVHWFFWTVPVLGIAISLAALRWVRTRSAEVSGRQLAVLGLLLSLLFLSWGYAQHTARRRTLARQAEAFCTDWLRRVEAGRLEEAHQMFLDPSNRRAPATDLARFYAENDAARSELDKLFGKPSLKPLADPEIDGQLEFRGLVENFGQEGGDMLILAYVYRYRENGEPRQVKFHVQMSRFLNGEGDIATWSLIDIYQV